MFGLMDTTARFTVDKSEMDGVRRRSPADELHQATSHVHRVYYLTDPSALLTRALQPVVLPHHSLVLIQLTPKLTLAM